MMNYNLETAAEALEILKKAHEEAQMTIGNLMIDLKNANPDVNLTNEKASQAILTMHCENIGQFLLKFQDEGE